MKKYIYQIYYNDETRRKLLPGFIPLDNTKNERPDWFEFWVILNFLRNNPLEDDAWYGFLSPKFYEKTGYDSEFVLNQFKNHGEQGDVALFSVGWSQLAYFLNPFEQGDVWHPGLSALSQKFVDKAGLGINLQKLVTDTSSSVFSNYIIAKKQFWLAWQKIAEEFFEYAENNSEYKTQISYGSIENQFPMKTFIQERLATLILATGNYKVIKSDESIANTILTRLFPDDAKTRRLLQVCDFMKLKYREKSDDKYLEMYWKVRADINYTNLKF